MPTEKTEREKMLAGELYYSFEEELLGMRQHAKELVYTFNYLRPNKLKLREQILKSLLGHMGKDCFVEPPFRCDYGVNIRVGDRFYCNYNCVILDCALVSIGDDVLIGPNVGIYAAGHPLHPDSRLKGLENAAPITIGDRVWIGGGVTIVGGVHIGENSVIGAGSVVVGDIPANVLAVGNPCRVLRPITEEDRRRELGE